MTDQQGRDKKGRWANKTTPTKDHVIRVTPQELQALQEAREKQVPLSKVISKDDKKQARKKPGLYCWQANRAGG